ncbi:MAG TPA: prolyl oligopeptidase family serine peptidase [Trebonia sp.]|jgi:pimeloyl-ACP methyl ester carboxylesterase|nr:prolyl oligopeptidase family serine peptidase [Trebonia sp.]
MLNQPDHKHGRPELERDNQQWIFDYLVQETGKVYHWWSDGGERFPKSVRSHAMISKHVGRKALQTEALARTEREAGHRETALSLYFKAAKQFMQAQHTIFVNNDEKIFLYSGMRRCYDAARDLCPYRIERIGIPWEGNLLNGYLHLNPAVDVAPLLFHLPGCDVTCETWPNPESNTAHARGFHVFSFDGPGQGASNIAGIPLTADNYERAASAALDILVSRPEIDERNVVVYGSGMGGYWGLSWANQEPRLRAAATKSTYADKYHLMNQESPRWKQLFMYMTQSSSERELDELAECLQLDMRVADVSCPVLMLTGEYDLRDPVDEVYRVFDALSAPAELWVFADQFHKLSLSGGETVNLLMLDWLRDRVDGRPQARAGQALYLDAGGTGPNGDRAAVKRKWFQ